MAYGKYWTDIMTAESIKILNEDPRTINSVVKLAVKHFPDLIAFRDNKGLSRTFLQLNHDVGLARSFLKHNGINPGDHVAIILGNNYDFVKSFLAITTYGCVAVLIPIQMPASNVDNIVKFTNCKLIINNSFLPSASNQVVTPETTVAPNDHAVIIFTGGTVGKPKATLLTHGNIARGTMNGSYGFKNSLRRVYYDLVPFTHVFGLIRNFLTGIVTGSEQFLCLDMKDFISDLSICRPTILVLVPALAELIWSLLRQNKQTVGGRLETIICGGAPVPEILIKRLFDEGVEIFPGYGLTETSNLTTGNAHPLDKISSVGHPFDHQEIKIVNNELWVKGENVVREYYHDEDNTKSFFEDGWFKTGDLVKIDQDGDVYIIGRIKNLIILDNGENVSPEALEAELKNYPLVRDSLVYADKNEAGNPVITVEIFPCADYAKAAKVTDIPNTIQKIVDEVNRRLPTYMGMHKVIVRETDFERGPSKKIIRKK